MTPRSRWWGALRLALGLGLLAYVLVRTGALPVLQHLASSPALLLAFVGQTLVGAVVEAQRLALLLRSQQIHLPLVRALRLVAMSVLFAYVVPGGVGGDVIKIHEMALEHRGRGVELAAVVLVDRITGLISLLTVALSAAFLSGSFATAPTPLRALALAAGFGIVAAIGGLVLAWSTPLRGTRLFQWITTRAPLHDVLERALGALYAFRDHKLAVLTAVGLTAIGHAALVGVFVLAGRVVMPGAAPGLVAWVSLLAMVANLLPLTPGGLGVGEAAFAGAFRLAGFAGGAQLLVLWRAALIPLATVGGMLYAFTGHKVRDNDARPEPLHV